MSIPSENIAKNDTENDYKKTPWIMLPLTPEAHKYQRQWCGVVPTDNPVELHYSKVTGTQNNFFCGKVGLFDDNFPRFFWRKRCRFWHKNIVTICLHWRGKKHIYSWVVGFDGIPPFSVFPRSFALTI